MKISIIIPTYNRNDLLERCLISFRSERQGVPKEIYEVVVSDDSLNGTARILINEKFPWAKWIEGPHRGPASNRNNGAKVAEGDWLIFIDDDCIPDERIIFNYIKAIESNSNVKAFEGCIKADRPKKHFLEESPINTKGGFFWTCNVMIEKSYFIQTLEGFDENFPFAAMEDVDIRERIKAKQESIVFVKEALVIHPWRIQKKYIETVRKRLLSEEYFFSKHPTLLINETLSNKIRNELRFYIKTILLKIIPYRGRGIFEFMEAHLIRSKFRRKIRKSLLKKKPNL